MSSTADRWFVPDQVYDNLISDYAVVGKSTFAVRENILYPNEWSSHISDAGDTFMSECALVYYEPCYAFAVNGRLVYADVDDEDPAHKERIYGEWAKEIPIEQESENTISVKKKVLDACVEGLYRFYFTKVINRDDEDEVPRSREDREPWARQDLERFISTGVINDVIVSEILTAKSLEDKEEILDVMSDQIGRLTKRPVMLLIKMIDSKQTTEVDETKGWAIGYDFIKELLVIKPFVSKEGSHPLGGKWHGEVAEDGVSFSGTLQEFVKAYIELGKTVDAGSPVDADSQDHGFKMLVHTVAAEWIYWFKADLEAVYGSDFYDDVLAIEYACVKIKKAMEQIELPVVEKNKEDGSDAGHPFGSDAGKPFESILYKVQCDDSDLRSFALAARENGEEKIAQNIATLYNHIEKLLQAFIDDPSMDLEL
ncbi:hypothetical protein MMC07_008527 [Pseudocyphellaria aurata]|nr:hypothetical protein [Pseudocyphellaria aurata]